MLVISAFQLVNSIIFSVEHSPGAKIADLLPHDFFIVVIGGGGGIGVFHQFNKLS